MRGSDEHELAGVLRAAVAGDEKAYGDFLRRAACVVRRLVRRRSAQYGVDLEDVVQETLLAIHVKRWSRARDANAQAALGRGGRGRTLNPRDQQEPRHERGGSACRAPSRPEVDSETVCAELKWIATNSSKPS